jgi:signal transduction histidine kinase
MPLRILVVDDIAASREALCTLVRDLGHQTLEAASGREALARVERDGPDLMLLDLLMPDIDGFEVSWRTRELTAGRWLPVIVTSSLEGHEHFIHALESGADDYLSRPINAALLQAKLHHYARVLALQGRVGALARRQRDILDNILDPVVTLDADGVVVEFNRAACGLADRRGRPLASGMTCTDLLGVTLAQLAQRRELELRRLGAAPFAAEVGLGEWRDGDKAQYTLMLRDITEQRQVQRMKDEFLATVSHELRTPLTSVMGALGLLAGGAAGELPPRALQLAQVARRNGERLGRLVDDILDLTKLEGDHLALHLRPQAPWPLLQEAMTSNQGFAERAGVRLVLEAWPADSPPPELRLDGDRFLQVMANLLSNAIKHSPPGASVRVGARPEAAGLCISVRDQGPGVDPRLRARMFEKFSQADGTDRRAQGGTGLGLYIARMLVERMGGRIRADEVTGPGASFSLVFPTASAGAEPPPALLLHVDVDAQMRERVAQWLAPAGRVEGVPRLAQAQPWLAEAALLIGNPQGQGAADGFCADLRRAADGRPVLLYGDSVDRSFCDRMQLPWLSPSRTNAADLLAWVQRALAARRAGSADPTPETTR